jgi:hypothetical protein
VDLECCQVSGKKKQKNPWLEQKRSFFCAVQQESKTKGLVFRAITNWVFEEMDVDVVVKLILPRLVAIANADTLNKADKHVVQNMVMLQK